MVRSVIRDIKASKMLRSPIKCTKFFLFAFETLILFITFDSIFTRCGCVYEERHLPAGLDSQNAWGEISRPDTPQKCSTPYCSIDVIYSCSLLLKGVLYSSECITLWTLAIFLGGISIHVYESDIFNIYMQELCVYLAVIISWSLI